MSYLTTFKSPEWALDSISAIVSPKYNDPGHKLRIDFLKFCDQQEFPIAIYGTDNFHQFKNYKGSLPSHQKENGLIPYRYTFNAEKSFYFLIISLKK